MSDAQTYTSPPATYTHFRLHIFLRTSHGDLSLSTSPSFVWVGLGLFFFFLVVFVCVRVCAFPWPSAHVVYPGSSSSRLGGEVGGGRS